MRLIAPNGVRVSVSEEKGARLLKEGYRSVPAPKPEPAVPAEKPKTAAKPKAKKPDESATEN